MYSSSKFPDFNPVGETISLLTNKMLHQDESKQQKLSLPEMDTPDDSSSTHIELKNNIHMCSTCNKYFSSKWNLKEHIQIHTSEKPYTCNHRQKSSTRKRELSFTRKYRPSVHMKTHPVKKLFQCEKCEKIFVIRNKLNRHMTVMLNLSKTVSQIILKMDIQKLTSSLKNLTVKDQIGYFEKLTV